MNFPGSSSDNAWELSEDEDDVRRSSTADFVPEHLNRFRLPSLQDNASPSANTVDISDEENGTDDEVAYEEFIEKEVFDLTGNDDLPESGHFVRRNPEIRGIRLAEIKWDGMPLKEGTFVKTKLIEKPHLQAKFLKIKTIYQEEVGEQEWATKIRGIPYKKSCSMKGMLMKHPLELVEVWDIDSDDPRPPELQSLVEIPITDILSIKQLVITNAPYPVHCGPRVLVCRWKMVRKWPSGQFRERNVATIRPDEYEASLLGIAPEEADKGFRASPDDLRMWRGGVVRGGTHKPAEGLSTTMPIVLDLDYETKERSPGQKYTFFDAFSGAGGASRAAAKAGFHLRYAVDMWETACITYQANFPRVIVYTKTINEFIVKSAREPIRADILHLSPPCQVFSPAHTVASASDDGNTAALFGCETIIEKVRPRIFTLEQTFGLMHERFSRYFNGLIQCFTSHGYSVRWKVVTLAKWGLPAMRKRLIMIGAGPGEKLPPFPRNSHSKPDGLGGLEPGTKPYVTVRDALYDIRHIRGREDHRPNDMPRINAAPWDANKILPRCITTSGGENYHYSGRRTFTVREYATLQGFPANHEFVAPSIKKQIGNAFPPVAAQHLFRHIRDWLLREDGMDDSGQQSYSRARSVTLPLTLDWEVLQVPDDQPTQSQGSSFSEPESLPSSGHLKQDGDGDVEMGVEVIEISDDDDAGEVMNIDEDINETWQPQSRCIVLN